MKLSVRNTSCALLFIIFISCQSQVKTGGYVLTARERKICDSIAIDTTIVQDIRGVNSGKIEPFHYSLGKIITKNEEIESDPIFLKGLVFPEQNSKSYQTVFSLKEKFTTKGYSIFLLENNFGIGDKPDAIGVLKTTDKYVVLQQVQTDGINYGITNDSLITIIKHFDKDYALELIGASGDWCEFIIHRDPSSWKAFAAEVYKACPDVVDQGTGTLEALAEELQRTRRLYFWWD
jgi:hypothetical protein